MATRLSKTLVHCFWCGKNDASKQCSCERANYCSETCLKADREEHRFNCSASKPTKDEFKVGAIVRISGLKSNQGRRMNGRYAEIIETSPQEPSSVGRLGVALTLDRKVKVAAIKRENLTLELSVLDAVKKSLDPEKCFETLAQKQIASDESPMKDTIHTMNPKEIVRRVRAGDGAVIQSLHWWSQNYCDGSHGSFSFVVSLHNNGLAAALLEPYTFPQAIDMTEDSDKILHMDSGPMILANQMGFIPQEYQVAEMDRFKMDVLSILGPTILTCASRKRRLVSQTERWWLAQRGLVCLLSHCFTVSDRRQALGVLKHKMDPIVAKQLAKYMIECMTVDHSLFLNSKQNKRVTGLEVFSAEVKITSTSVLRNLIQNDDDEKFAAEIANMTVPAGAPGLTGRRFAECFLDCAAHLALLEGPPELGHGPHFGFDLHSELRCMQAHFFVKCESLHSLFEMDKEFYSYEIGGLEDFQRWARARLGSNE